MGIVMYSLLYKIIPFFDQNGKYNILSHLKGEINFNPMSKRIQPVTPDATDLMRNMLHPDPDQRFTIAQALEHKWFKNHKIYGTPPPKISNTNQMKAINTDNETEF